MTTTLTSAQAEVLERIRPPRDERRSWPRHLRAELRNRIQACSFRNGVPEALAQLALLSGASRAAA